MPSRSCLLTDLGARLGVGVADWDLEAFLLRLEADGSLTRLRARASASAAVGAARTTHPHPRTHPPGHARNDDSGHHQDHIAAKFGTVKDDVAKRFRPPLPPLEPASPLLLPDTHTPADPDADDATFVDAEESLDDATSAAVVTTAGVSPRLEVDVALPPPEPDLEPDLAFSAGLGLFEPAELGTLAAVYSSSSLALSSSSSSGGLPAVGSSSTLAGLDDGGSTAASSELEDWDRWTSSNTEDGASTSTDGEWLNERDRDVVGPTTSAASTVASRWGFNGLVGKARAVTTAHGYGGGDVAKGERGCGVVVGRTGSGGGQQGSMACAGSCDSLVGLDLEADVDADRRLSEEEEHDAVVNDDDLQQFMAELAGDEADGEETKSTGTGVGVCGDVAVAGPEQGGQHDGRHQEKQKQQEEQKEQQDEQQEQEQQQQQQHQEQKHEQQQQQQQQQMQHHQHQPRQHGNVPGRGGRAATAEARSTVLDGWRLMMNRSTHTMHYCSWVRDPGSCGGTEYRGRLVVRGLSPETVRDFLLDEDYRAEWDENRLVSETLEEWDERGCTAVRWVRRLPFFLKNREYVVARRVWNPQPHTFFCISRLLARHPAAPVRSNTVRVSTFYSSWRLRIIPWACAVSSAGGAGAGPDTGNGANASRCGEMAVEVITHHEEESGLQKDLARMGVARSMWSHIQRMENALRAYAASGRNARHQLPVFLIQADARVSETDALAAAAAAEAGTAPKPVALAAG